MLHLLRHSQRPHEVGEIVGPGVTLAPAGVVVELAAGLASISGPASQGVPDPTPAASPSRTTTSLGSSIAARSGTLSPCSRSNTSARPSPALCLMGPRARASGSSPPERRSFGPVFFSWTSRWRVCTSRIRRAWPLRHRHHRGLGHDGARGARCRARRLRKGAVSDPDRHLGLIRISNLWDDQSSFVGIPNPSYLRDVRKTRAPLSL